LVTKVHVEVAKLHKEGYEFIMIGHKGHPEVEGTMGQLPAGAVTLIETSSDVDALAFAEDIQLAFVTQTTLSVDDTREVIGALKAKYPSILGPHREDICYATTNRQAAVDQIAPKVEAMIVVGAPNSSNSLRLKELAERRGCKIVQMVLRASDIDWTRFAQISSLGVTAGASAPEILVDEILAAFEQRFELSLETLVVAREDMSFPLPRELRDARPV
jgi:4-hydroxy-3-methylbut-2-enyl diphosphate reductase